MADVTYATAISYAQSLLADVRAMIAQVTALQASLNSTLTASKEVVPTSGTTVQCLTGVAQQTIFLRNSFPVDTIVVQLPVSPADGNKVAIEAESGAIASITYTNGTTGPRVPKSLAAGALMTLTYSGSSSTWR